MEVVITFPTLKRASASRPFCQWPGNDFDVLANGKVVGRIKEASKNYQLTAWNIRS
jgi:hypothetical protein